MRTSMLKGSVQGLASLAVGIMFAGAAWGMGGNLATKGEALLNDNCARCHSVGAEGDSKIKTIKPFREIIAKLPADDLGNVFVAAMSAKHKQFSFEPMDVKAIGDYLDKLKTHVEGAKK